MERHDHVLDGYGFLRHIPILDRYVPTSVTLAADIRRATADQVRGIFEQEARNVAACLLLAQDHLGLTDEEVNAIRRRLEDVIRQWIAAHRKREEQK